MADEQTDNPSSTSGNSGSGAPAPRSVEPARILDYGRSPAGRFIDWIRRDEVRGFVKSMAWVIPLTILIWVYAEREQITQTAPWPIPVTVKTTVPNKHVSLVSSDRNIMARLAGPRGLVDEVANILTTGTPQRVEILITDDMLAGRSRTVINVPTSWIGNNPLFKSRGVSVFECSPVALQVAVDDLVDQQMTVAAPPGTDRVDGLPTFTPATVVFHGPSKLLDNKAFYLAPDGKTYYVYADFSDPALFKTDGLNTTATLPLKRPADTAGDPYTLSATVVEAKFTLKQQDKKGKINSMPVFIKGPPAMLDEFRVEIVGGPTLANVEVSGPPAVIDLLNTSELVPVPTAILEILPGDRPPAGQPPAQLSRTPRFELPPDLKITPPAAQTKIQFTLQPRG